MPNKNKKSLQHRAQEASHVKNLLKSVPDIRSNKVKNLKTGVNDGTYKVNVEQVAEKIIEKTLKTSARIKKGT